MNHDYTQFVKEAALRGLMLELRDQIDTLEVLLDAYADLRSEEYDDLKDALTKLRKIEEELTRLNTVRTIDQALRYAFDIGLTLN